MEDRYRIRELHQDEYRLLDDFLYEAIFIPEGIAPPDRSIINQPELQIYTADFGKKDDHALAAVCDGKVIGCVWGRIVEDYGHIDAKTPSLGISLFPEYRNRGIGTALLQQMLTLLRDAGYDQVSLSVQKANYAYRMYRSLGFRVIADHEEEWIMVCSLRNELLSNVDQLHTTERGIVRIKDNLSLDTDDVIRWCRQKITSPDAVIYRRGKNWYVHVDGCTITVNASSYTVITAHRAKDIG